MRAALTPFDYAPNERLIVYGSLAPGAANHAMLAKVDGIWMPASIRGTLQAQGWAAGAGYPGIRIHADGPTVAAQLFCSSQLPELWAQLDAFEGRDYRRMLVEAEVAGGTLTAFIYELAA